jgi:hypothetical protein
VGVFFNPWLNEVTMEFDRDKIRYTIVQHSRCGYGGDQTFKYFLEERIIMSQKELDKIKKSGGLILDNYKSAEAWTSAPPSRIQGKFSRLKIDGLKIYVPLKIMMGAKSYATDPLRISFSKHANGKTNAEVLYWLEKVE